MFANSEPRSWAGNRHRNIALCTLLSVTLTWLCPSSSAQVGTSGESAPASGAQPKPANAAPTFELRSRIVTSDGELQEQENNRRLQQYEERKQRMRERLADPVQREQIVAARVQKQHAENPDLGRLLGLDAATEEKLLRLLIDQSLAGELREDDFTRTSGEQMLQQDAAQYDQQLRDITGIIGEARLEAWLDYDRSRYARTRLEGFNTALPATAKFTAAQKDALVPLLANHDRQRYQGMPSGSVDRLMANSSLEKGSAEYLQRSSQLLTILVNEQTLRRMEVENRELAERMPQFLDAEQIRAYAQLLSQQVESMRAHTQKLRRDAGIGLDEVLDSEDTERERLGNTRLQLTLRINGREVTKTVTSKRGAAVTFDAPGLLVEVQPTHMIFDQLGIDLRFYEAVRGGRRPVGQAQVQAGISSSKQPSASRQMATRNLVVLRGRKAYALECSAEATFL